MQEMKISGLDDFTVFIVGDWVVKMGLVLQLFEVFVEIQGLYVYQIVVNTEMDFRKGF